VLVLRPGALGDTLLALPALRALRRRFPERLTLAAHGPTARFLASIGEVDQGMAFDDPRLAWLFRPAGQPTDERVIAWLDPSNVPGLREALVVAPSRPSGTDLHCSRHLLQSLEAIGCDQELDAGPLRVAPIASDDVLVHPGSGSRAKNWPAERFAAVIAHLPCVRLIVGEADAAVVERVEACVGRPVPQVQVGLTELAGRLAGCRAYLGNDSGVSHLAGLCGARAIVLFGPTPDTVWRPLGPRVIVRDFGTKPEAVAAELLRDG